MPLNGSKESARSIPGQAFWRAIRGWPLVLRAVLALLLVIVLWLLLQVLVPPALSPLCYVLPAVVAVGYLALEVGLRIAWTRARSSQEMGDDLADVGGQDAGLFVPVESRVPDPEADRLAYLGRLRAMSDVLPLQYAGSTYLGAERPEPGAMALCDVYVPLDTTAFRPRGAEQGDEPGMDVTALPALVAADGEPRMVLLGEPGAGKSTFAKYLALCMAGELSEMGRGWLARLQPAWRQGPLFPVWVVLRDFGSSPHCDGTVDGLWRYIVGELGSYAPRLRRQMASDGGALLLFDGLDEILDEARRTLAHRAVVEFVQQYNHPRNRCLVTCGTHAYQDARWRLPEHFAVYTLAPFSPRQVDAWIDCWTDRIGEFGWTTRSDAATLSARLKGAVRQPGRMALASRPLLLTMMALLYTTRGHMPQDRSRLYMETVDLLLDRWQVASPDAAAEADHLVDVGLVRAALERLAFVAQSSPGEPEEAPGISEKALGEALAQADPGGGWDVPGVLRAHLQDRAGVLVERAPGIYDWPHPSLQEVLAAAYLSVQPAFAQEITRLVEQSPGRWHPILMFAVGILSHVRRMPHLAVEAVRELDPRTEAPRSPAGRGTVKEEKWHMAWLAGQALLEIGLQEARQCDAALVDRVLDWLVALIEAGALTPTDRVAAGRALAVLGDPRFDPDAWYLPRDLLWGFVEVPEGSFLMGTAQDGAAGSALGVGQRQPGRADEMPQHQVTLSTYYMSRYPVTVAQFRAFVEQAEYDAGTWSGSQASGNCAVTGVTWYDATAYCRWLTEQMRARKDTPEPLAAVLRDLQGSVRLPSEAEWEKAARGIDGRVYPWGDGARPELVNCQPLAVGTTCAVGCFPGGASSYGVLDMSGNVWEWTRSLWGQDVAEPQFGYPYDPTDGREDAEAGPEVCRVLRGGSFADDLDGVRCARRGRGKPQQSRGNVGFCVVIAAERAPEP